MIPDISIVIPAKNRVGLIGRAVRSVINQRGFPPGALEIIVVDDGSSDGTQDAVRKYASTSPHPLQLMVNARTPGANGARNTGVEAARGRWVALLDSDDAFAPDKLVAQMQGLRGSSCGAATSSWVSVSTNGRMTPHIYSRNIQFSGTELTSRLAWDTGFGTPTYLVHRDLIKCAGLFDEQLRRRQDYEWTIRLARYTAILAVARSILVVYKQKVSIGADASLIVPATRAILTKHRWLYARHPGSSIGQLVKMVQLNRRTKRLA